jgi:hypothetical protein
MPLYGYARVSTLDQDLSIQRAALKAAGCEVIRAEKASGTRRDGRTELQVLFDFLRDGDTDEGQSGRICMTSTYAIKHRSVSAFAVLDGSKPKSDWK